MDGWITSVVRVFFFVVFVCSWDYIRISSHLVLLQSIPVNVFLFLVFLFLRFDVGAARPARLPVEVLVTH